MVLPSGCHPDCPACAHRDLTLSASRQQKSHWLKRRLAPWSGVLAPLRALGDSEVWGYRDRVSLAAEWSQGNWQFGVRRKEELVPIHHCPVHSARVNALVALLVEVLPGPDNFQLAFLSQSGSQAVLILKQPEPPEHEWFNMLVASRLEEVGLEALWIHCFPAVGRNLFTKNGWQLLWGKERSQDGDGYWYGPGAFSQLLPQLHAESLDEAQAFLAPSQADRVVDLYCGRGLSLARWLACGAEALGVELGAEALACAALNVPGAELLRGGCAQRLPQLQRWWQDTPEENRLAYLNPPRTGLEPEVVKWVVLQGLPRRIAYLSCSAGTLARDLELLQEGGYRVVRITPYDFFPRTYHVETLVLIERGLQGGGSGISKAPPGGYRP